MIDTPLVRTSTIDCTTENRADVYSVFGRDYRCGDWDGGRVLCDRHNAEYGRTYPQGWRHYPGDVCPHGKYTGGSGIDWMCGQCESE
jgi:hypothetical protein